MVYCWTDCCADSCCEYGAADRSDEDWCAFSEHSTNSQTLSTLFAEHGSVLSSIYSNGSSQGKHSDLENGTFERNINFKTRIRHKLSGSGVVGCIGSVGALAFHQNCLSFSVLEFK